VNDKPPLTWHRAIVAAVVPYVACSTPIFLVGTLALRLREDLGIDEARLGGLIATFAVGGAITAPTLGRVAERLGPGLSLRLASFSSGIAMLTISVVAKSWLTLALLTAAAGASASFMQASSNLWLARTMRGHRLGLAFGLKQSGGPAAALLAGLAVPTLGIAIGWRWTFAGFGMFALLATLSVPRVSLPLVEVRRARPTGDVSLRPLVVITMGVAISTAVSTSFTGFAVTAAVQQGGIDESMAGFLFAAGALTGIGTRIALGHWVDHNTRRHFELPAMLVAAGAIGFLVLSTGAAPAFVFGVPFSFATAWGWVGVFHHALTRANNTSPAAATGITLVGSNIGVIAGPAAFGLIFGRSFAAAWIVAAVGSVLGATVLAVGGRMIEKDKRPSGQLARNDSLGHSGTLKPK